MEIGNGVKMEKKRGRPAKYLLLDEWQRFLREDFYHLKLWVKILLWLNGGIALAVITKLVKDFFWG